MQPWQKAGRLTVYTALWLAFFLHAEIRYRQALGVPRTSLVLVFVTGLMLSVMIVETIP